VTCDMNAHPLNPLTNTDFFLDEVRRNA
jgi:hypothetical protein